MKNILYKNYVIEKYFCKNRVIETFLLNEFINENFKK